MFKFCELTHFDECHFYIISFYRFKWYIHFFLLLHFKYIFVLRYNDFLLINYNKYMSRRNMQVAKPLGTLEEQKSVIKVSITK